MQNVDDFDVWYKVEESVDQQYWEPAKVWKRPSASQEPTFPP